MKLTTRSVGDCGSCQHWHNPWTDEPRDDYVSASSVDEPARWGTCDGVGLIDRHERVPGDVMAFTRDASDYVADLHTRDDFGCALWVEKAPIPDALSCDPMDHTTHDITMTEDMYSNAGQRLHVTWACGVECVAQNIGPKMYREMAETLHHGAHELAEGYST